jgi:hypothetical protein
MSIVPIALILMAIGWLITESDGKIGDTKVTSGSGKGKEAAKIIFGGLSFGLLIVFFIILMALSA